MDVDALVHVRYDPGVVVLVRGMQRGQRTRIAGVVRVADQFIELRLREFALCHVPTDLGLRGTHARLRAAR